MNFLTKNWFAIVVLVILSLSLLKGTVESPAAVGGVTNLDSLTLSGTLSAEQLTTTDDITVTDALSVGGETTLDGLTEGGGTVTVTPLTSSVTLTEANLLAGNIITFTASTTIGAVTVTLPATSTMTTLLASDGDKRSWMIENPFTGAATTTTIAAGTGIDLQEPDGQNVVIGINNYAWLTCFREASTDVVCRVDETIPAD